MDSPFGMGVVHNKGVRASIWPPGRLRPPSPLLRILGLWRHLVELDVVLMVHIELEPAGIRPARLLIYDLPCHRPGGSIVLVVPVFAGSSKLCIAVLDKPFMPLFTNSCGLQIVPLHRLLIGVQLAVLDILVVDGVEVYGPLDLFLPIPVLKGYALDPPCSRLVLDRLAQPGIDLPVGLSLEHRLHALSEEGEEGVAGRLPDIPPLVVGGR